MIDNFSGRHAFLSNFFIGPVRIETPWDRLSYSTVEHAFQAQKTLSIQDRIAFTIHNNPGKAKRAGRKLTLRHDWEEIKIPLMRRLVEIKFVLWPIMTDYLLSTGDEELVEGNTWNDTFWGVCNGVGKNNLGKLLMEVRSKIKDIKNA